MLNEAEALLSGAPVVCAPESWSNGPELLRNDEEALADFRRPRAVSSPGRPEPQLASLSQQVSSLQQQVLDLARSVDQQRCQKPWEPSFLAIESRKVLVAAETIEANAEASSKVRWEVTNLANSMDEMATSLKDLIGTLEKTVMDEIALVRDSAEAARQDLEGRLDDRLDDVTAHQNIMLEYLGEQRRALAAGLEAASLKARELEAKLGIRDAPEALEERFDARVDALQDELESLKIAQGQAAQATQVRILEVTAELEEKLGEASEMLTRDFEEEDLRKEERLDAAIQELRRDLAAAVQPIDDIWERLTTLDKEQLTHGSSLQELRSDLAHVMSVAMHLAREGEPCPTDHTCRELEALASRISAL